MAKNNAYRRLRRGGKHSRRTSQWFRPVLRWGALLVWSALLGWFCIWALGLFPQRTPEKQEQPAREEFRPEVGEPPYIIAVDAGHGGTDPGAIGIVEERQMTAQTAEALCALLEKDPSYIPVHTRDGYDVTAKPSERAEYANRQTPDLLLSIHGNSAPEGSEASGFECYPAVPGRTWHQESYFFAQLLAEGMSAAGASLRGSGGIRYIYYLENGEKKIAETNYAAIREERSFTILEDVTCPAVLAEQCFVTNESDVERFGTEEGCQRAAQIYYEAICRYFGTQAIL